MISLCLALTTHIAIGGGWNEVHPCVRYEQDGWTVGAFLNSEDAVSAYASHTWQDGPWFIEGGLVTGYSAAAVLPMIRAGFDIAKGVRLFVTPAYDTFSDQFGAALGIELSIGRGRK